MELHVRFSSQALPGSWFIRFFRWIPFSHVEIAMSNGRTLGARVFGGVKIRPPRRYSHQADIIVDVPEALWIEALKMQGRRYDLVGLFAFLFRIKMQVSRWFTCVEFVAELLAKHKVIYIPDTRPMDPFTLYLVLLNLNKGRTDAATTRKENFLPE